LFRDTARQEIETTEKATGSGVDPDHLLSLLGIGELASQHPRDVSAGQRLLVAIGAIVATGARVLLLDEPTRGLDHEAKELLVAFLRRHAAEGGAAIIATHDVELVGELATRVIMLAQGEVISEGDPHDVIGDSTVFAPQTARVFGKSWLTPEEAAGAVVRSERVTR
jgi:energy-coupling factor transport system ATP-binding protein